MTAVVVMGDGDDCGGSSSSNTAVQPAGSITLPMVITLYVMMMINNNKSFDVLLTMHLSIFILVINQLDAQNLFYN